MKHTNFVKENAPVLIAVGLISIAFPILILCPSKYGIIPRDVGLQIVGYGGSILGGLLTLYGVWWTIKKQDNLRREDLAIQYKPFISLVELETSIPVNNGFNRICYCPCKNISPQLMQLLNAAHDCCELNFKLSNIGRGTLCSVYLKEVILESEHFKPSISYKQKLLCSIVKDDSVYLVLELPPLLVLKNEFHDLENSVIKASISLVGTDEFNFNTFYIKLNLNIKTSIDIFSEETNELIITPTYIPESLKTEMYVVDGKK